MQIERATLKTAEAAVYIGISKPEVYKAMHREHDPLPALRIGRNFLVIKAHLDAWIDRNAQTTAQLLPNDEFQTP
jgi:excisionase family DNA binding protein